MRQIQPGRSGEGEEPARLRNMDVDVQAGVSECYRRFGALFSVLVCRGAAGAQPGFYAVVKFYSAEHASRAQRATHGRGLFQEAPLKVSLCTRQNRFFYRNVSYLHSSKCHELANFYLGFNGWSSRVVTLKDLSKSDGPEQVPLGEATQTVNLKYGCIVELIFTKHGVSCRGVGVAEEVFPADTDPEELLMKRGMLQKSAKERAISYAFQKVLLVVLGNGKVAVECKLDPDEILTEEEVDGLIQVNEISWSQFESVGEDEDVLCDLSLNISGIP
ncbi:RAD52 motif-containing protein 1 isoform X2 [Amia ocellicauda]|uniref:RAD52 motif-containing protein 1 isoform X2 n=1 Tax=Amia ocellicauda TaxID=2972642 RepID=UPI003463CE01